MIQYIDKSALAAEIEKIIADETESIKSFEHSKNVSEVQRSNARLSVLYCIQSFLDTLEVKEVDSNDTFIDKACEFLKSYRRDTPDGYGYIAGIVDDKTIEDFKKYMKGE